MDLTTHCSLCDNQIVDFKTGTTCGLTNEKPDFRIKCSKIQLTEKFENKLKAVNVDFEKIKRTKSATYFYSVVLGFAGLVVIIGGYVLGEYIFEKGFISTVPLIIMVLGLTPLGMAVGILNKYRRGLKIAQLEKSRIDEVLKVYSIEYDIAIAFGKEYHGNQEVYTELLLRKG
jgi:F0F1-type ATP synthase assembly protein I